MRIASKLMLLALLALPMGCVYAAAPPPQDLTITINVTVSDEVNCVFCATDGTEHGTAQIWALSIALAANLDNPATIYTDIKNKGNMQVDVTVQGSGGAPWTIDTAPAANIFTMTATKNGGATTMTLDAAWQSYGAAIPGGGAGKTSGTKLNFAAPATVTSMAPPAAITATYRCTATP